jgi:MFS family permease
VNSLVAHPSTTEVTAINLILAVLFSLTGLVFGIFLMDRIPRKTQQKLGLSVCGLALLSIGVIPAVTANLAIFVVVFGVSSFGSTFGPSPTTMVFAAESFPVGVRATGHGLSAGIGKAGAAVAERRYSRLDRRTGSLREERPPAISRNDEHAGRLVFRVGY